MPLITLTTDFGLSDIYVGVMKGVICTIAPHARVIDLTHDVPPQSVSVAAFLLEAAAPYFPWGAVHVAVVDPGVGSGRRIVCARTSRATYLAPDNGLLGPVLERDPPAHVYSVENPEYFLPEVSSTFHGRDIFSPVAAHLALGLDPRHLGTEVDSLRDLRLPRPSSLGVGRLAGEVLHVDRFGNLVTNLRLDDLGRVREARVEGRAVAGPVRAAYAECAPGEVLLIGGSSGLLEVSVNQGSAAALLGAGRGASIEVNIEAREESP
ncbi:MAG: S-adenosyl-l-methionine hydroxide adenosyltransferase family protein [Planctomycetota bacterium]